MRSLQHTSDLAPFAAELRDHLAASALLPRSSEIDHPLLELLIGCEFVSTREAELMLSPHWRRDASSGSAAAAAAIGLAGTAAGDDELAPLPPTTPAARASEFLDQRCTPHETL